MRNRNGKCFHEKGDLIDVSVQHCVNPLFTRDKCSLVHQNDKDTFSHLLLMVSNHADSFGFIWISTSTPVQWIRTISCLQCQQHFKMTFWKINSTISMFFWVILRSHCGQFSLELLSVEQYVETVFIWTLIKGWPFQSIHCFSLSWNI